MRVLRSRTPYVALGLGLLLLGVPHRTAAGEPPPVTGQSATQGPFAPFVGSWQWMFQGKPFATLTLTASSGDLTGTLTNAHVSFDGAGHIVEAEPDAGTSVVVKGAAMGSVLHFTVKQGDDLSDWTMTLQSPNQAEVRLTAASGSPENVQPIVAQRVR